MLKRIAKWGICFALALTLVFTGAAGAMAEGEYTYSNGVLSVYGGTLTNTTRNKTLLSALNTIAGNNVNDFTKVYAFSPDGARYSAENSTFTFTNGQSYSLYSVTWVSQATWNDWTAGYWDYSDSPIATFTAKIYDKLTVTVSGENAGTVSASSGSATASSTSSNPFTLKVYRGSSATITAAHANGLKSTITAGSLSSTKLDAANTLTIESMSSDIDAAVVYAVPGDSTFTVGSTDGANVTLNPSDGIVSYNGKLSLTAEPADNTYITSVVVKDNDGDVVYEFKSTDSGAANHYSDGTLTLTDFFTATTPDAEYTIEVTAVPCAIVLKDNLSIDFPADDLHASIFALIDTSASIPGMTKDNIIIEYKTNRANPLSDTWGALDNNFGSGILKTEKIKITYNPANAIYPTVTTGGFYVSLLKPTYVQLSAPAENLTFDVNRTEKEIFDMIFKGVTVDEAGTTAIDDTLVYNQNVFMVLKNNSNPLDTMNTSEVGAGNLTASVTYLGKLGEYAPDTEEIRFTVARADAQIRVKSDTYTYKAGTAITNPVSASAAAPNSSDAVGYMTIVAGIDMNARGYLKVNLPAGIDWNLGSVSLGELGDKIEPVLKTAGLDDASIAAVKSAINSVASLSGLSDISVSFSTGNAQQIMPTDSGVYLISSIIADPNYTTDSAIGYAVIRADGTPVELAFNVSDANGFITKEKIDSGEYDLGSKVVTQGHSAAENHLYNLFFGVTSEGKPFIKEYKNGVKPSLPYGVYTQISYVKDWNNQMYYAAPIVRSFTVVPRTVDVHVTDKSVDYEAGVRHAADVSVKLAGSEITGERKTQHLTVVYTGVSAAVSAYGPTTTPPSERGVYSVLATYVEYESDGETPKYVGVDMGTLTIGKGSAVFDVKDAEFKYEAGVERFPEVDNPENLPAIYVIRDQSSGVNILLPSGWNIGSGTYDVENAVETLLSALGQLPESVKNADAIAALKDVLGRISVKKLSINGKKPIDPGTYSIIGIAYGPNYGAVTDEGILTISTSASGGDDGSTSPTTPDSEVLDALGGLPQTGDDSSVLVWLCALIASAGALLVLSRRKKAAE